LIDLGGLRAGGPAIAPHKGSEPNTKPTRRPRTHKEKEWMSFLWGLWPEALLQRQQQLHKLISFVSLASSPLFLKFFPRCLFAPQLEPAKIKCK